MISILLRHYRRFAIFGIGMALFSVAIALSWGTEASHLNIFVVFMVGLIGFTAIGVGLYSMSARQRGILEIAGAAAILSAFVMINLPPRGILPAVTGLALFFAVMTFMWFFLQSPTSEKLFTGKTWTDRHSGPVPYPAKLVWKHIIPGAAEPQDHCTGIMERYEEDAEDPTTINVDFKARKGRRATYSLTFLERTKPSVCRFFFQGEEADGTVVDGIFVVHITATDSQNCFVAVNEERRGLSMGTMIERWFDDALGYQYDRLLDLLNARYGSGQAIISLDDDQAA